MGETILPLHAGNPGPMTGSGNWTYFIPGRAPLLVDAGIGVASHLDAIAAVRADGPGHVVVTHAHSDHIAGATSLRERWAKTRFSKLPWPGRDDRDGIAWSRLVDGEQIAAGDGELQVLHTPGHAPDHVALWHASSRTLLSGDLLVAGSTVVIPASSGGSLTAYLQSLERIRGLRPRRILPAHGPVIDDPDTLIAEYLAHRHERERQVQQALARGRRTVADIVGDIYRGLAPALLAMAAESVLAHLLKLSDEKQAQRDGDEWYAPAAGRLRPPLPTPAMEQIVDLINVNRDRYVDELKEYLAIPSISALPAHKDDVRRCAEWTADQMRRIGLQQVRLEETPGHPVVYGEWSGAEGAPTILFYGHYDVQPVDPVELWTSPPFEATVRDGEIYARGSADDKGQVFMHFKAVEAHIARGGRLPVNMKFLLEGEEEVGSANLDAFIASHKDLLRADVVVISDSPMFDRGIPSICYGLRGLAYYQIDLRGTRSDLHSGSFGGAVANPAMVLAQLLAQMKDRSGRIKIPGFYDDVVELRPEERAEFAKLPFNERKYRQDLGAPKLAGEAGYTTLERIWGRPTFEVNGLLAGFTGEGAKTVIPAVAMAKVSMRLVPNQDPVKIGTLFEEYVRKIAPKTVELSLTRMHGGKPWMTDFDNPFVQAAGRAIEKGFGQRPVFNREGGSIPVVATFQEELGLPCVLFGIGLPDENAHAPDEKLDLGNFHNGVIAAAYLYQEVGALPRA